jgi:hypothetical protein
MVQRSVDVVFLLFLGSLLVVVVTNGGWWRAIQILNTLLFEMSTPAWRRCLSSGDTSDHDSIFVSRPSFFHIIRIPFSSLSKTPPHQHTRSIPPWFQTNNSKCRHNEIVPPPPHFYIHVLMPSFISFYRMCGNGGHSKYDILNYDRDGE